MTKKDYVKIAAAFADNHPSKFENLPGGPEQIWDMLRQAMLVILATDNPNFDRARFNKACGMETENA